LLDLNVSPLARNSLDYLASLQKLKFNIGANEDFMLNPNGEIDPDLNLLGNRLPDAQYMAPTDMIGNFTKYKNLSNIMHINALSVSSKMTGLQIIMDQLPVSILALTETWLT